MNEQQTDPNLVEAGKLRERVKKGEIDPRIVLEWVKKQPAPSDGFIRFLRNRITGKFNVKKEPERKKKISKEDSKRLREMSKETKQLIKKGLEQAKRGEFVKGPNLEANKDKGE